MKRASPCTLIVIAAAVATLSHCEKETAAGKTPAGPALATVAGEAITAEDLEREAAWRRANGRRVPGPGELLEEMVERRALIARAEREGVADSYDARRRYGSLLIARLREERLQAELDGIEIPDAEIEAAYQERLGEYSRAALDRFAILFLEADDTLPEERRSEVRERLEEGLEKAGSSPAPGGRGAAAGGFGSVAIEYSDDQISRYRGGDIGWIPAGEDAARVPEPVLAEGRALEKGACSGVIETDRGYYAIMKTDARAGGAKPLAEVAGELRRTLRREKEREVRERFLAESLESAGASLDAEAARAVELSESPSPSPEDRPPSFPPASSQ